MSKTVIASTETVRHIVDRPAIDLDPSAVDLDPSHSDRCLPPAHLAGIAADLWRQLFPAIAARGPVTGAMRALLELRCLTHERLMAATSELAGRGGSLTYRAPSGLVKPWPEIAIIQRAESRISELDRRLGLR